MNLIHSWLTRQDNFITFLYVTVITDLAPQAAEANRGGPGAIKMTANKLTLNVRKTKCILIGSKFKLSQTDNHSCSACWAACPVTNYKTGLVVVRTIASVCENGKAILQCE